MLAYFIATFVFSWWYRWRHESGLLWPLVDQIHHSPRRIEVLTSFFVLNEVAITHPVGALLLEQGDERQPQRRYMRLERLQQPTDNQPARRSALIS